MLLNHHLEVSSFYLYVSKCINVSNNYSGTSVWWTLHGPLLCICCMEIPISFPELLNFLLYIGEKS